MNNEMSPVDDLPYMTIIDHPREQFSAAHAAQTMNLVADQFHARHLETHKYDFYPDEDPRWIAS
jgi:hypothetical protein